MSQDLPGVASAPLLPRGRALNVRIIAYYGNGKIHKHEKIMSMTKPFQEILFGKSLLWIKRRRSFNLYCSCIGHLRMVNFPPTIGRHKVTATKRRASYEFCHPIIPTFSIHSLKKSTRYFRTVLQHAFSTCLEALPFRGRRP